MDSDQDLLDAYNEREDAENAAKQRRNREDRSRFENAAKEAHKVRMMARLVHNLQVPSWDEMHLGSQQHLIADAANVAENSLITEGELRALYQERLVASGDTENPDLGSADAVSEYIEDMVLTRLKAALSC